MKRVFDPVSQALLNTTTYLYGLNGEALGQTLYNASGSKASGQYWFWLDGMPLAQVNTDFAADGTISASKVLYLHTDHLNTSRLATDSAQTLLWSWNSDAYGVGAPNEDVDGDGNATEVALRFPGQVYDATSHYNAQTGGYVQSDPIGLSGGINTYGYVGGNPLNFIDPTGEAMIEIPVPNVIYDLPDWITVPSGRARGVIGLILSIPGDTPQSEAKEQEQNNCSKGDNSCPPCDPPVGTTRYRVDLVPPSKPHPSCWFTCPSL